MTNVTAQNVTLLQNSIMNVLKTMISRMVPKNNKVSDVEIDSLMQICVMGILPTGDEEPRELMRRLSDNVLDHLISHLQAIKQSPIVGKIGQFFLIEWCYRNDYLNGDWKWQWDSPNEGHVSFDPKIPLDQVVLPKQQELPLHEGLKKPDKP
jgi:hypothetical protein